MGSTVQTKKKLQEINELMAQEINELRLINKQVEAGQINNKQFKIRMKAYKKTHAEIKKAFNEMKKTEKK